MSKWDKPLPILFATVIFGYFAIAYNQFEPFVVVILAFILAKQFEK